MSWKQQRHQKEGKSGGDSERKRPKLLNRDQQHSLGCLVADPSDKALMAFVKWCKASAGVSFSDNVTITSKNVVHGRGMVALEDICEDHVLFTIPKTALWNLNTTCASKVLGDEGIEGWPALLMAMIAEYAAGYRLTASATAAEPPTICSSSSSSSSSASSSSRVSEGKAVQGTCRTSPLSKFQAYIGFLPALNSLTHPHLWPEELLGATRGTQLHDATKRDIREMEECYTRYLAPLSAKYPAVFPPEYCTKSLFRQISCIAMAYSFTDDIEGITSMVPVADILNAAPGKNNARIFHTPDSLQMRAVYPIAKGAEIFNTYGDLSNMQLILKHGYCESEPTTFEETDILVDAHIVNPLSVPETVTAMMTSIYKALLDTTNADTDGDGDAIPAIQDWSLTLPFPPTHLLTDAHGNEQQEDISNRPTPSEQQPFPEILALTPEAWLALALSTLATAENTQQEVLLKQIMECVLPEGEEGGDEESESDVQANAGDTSSDEEGLEEGKLVVEDDDDDDDDADADDDEEEGKVHHQAGKEEASLGDKQLPSEEVGQGAPFTEPFHIYRLCGTASFDQAGLVAVKSPSLSQILQATSGVFGDPAQLITSAAVDAFHKVLASKASDLQDALARVCCISSPASRANASPLRQSMVSVAAAAVTNEMRVVEEWISRCVNSTTASCCETTSSS